LRRVALRCIALRLVQIKSTFAHTVFELYCLDILYIYN
jgi:hypothetical protein